jgi:hypothetical protein
LEYGSCGIKEVGILRPILEYLSYTISPILVSILDLVLKEG